jgi:hypothetical protein
MTLAAAAERAIAEDEEHVALAEAADLARVEAETAAENDRAHEVIHEPEYFYLLP